MTTVEHLAAIGKKHANHSEERHIELGRIIQCWQRHPGGAICAPERVKRAGMRAREMFFKENALLVVKFASKSKHLINGNSVANLEDLVQELCIGFNRAIERYDPERGTRFSTLATWWLMQARNRYLSRNRSLIAIPCHILLLIRKLGRQEVRLDELTPSQRARIVDATKALDFRSLDQLCGQSEDNRSAELGDVLKVEEPADSELESWLSFKDASPQTSLLLQLAFVERMSQASLAKSMSVKQHRIRERLEESMAFAKEMMSVR